jgi:ribosomal protein S18 acetylase RimI-like enzyme
MPPDIREFRPEHYRGALALWETTEGIGLSGDDSEEGITRFLARNPGLSFVAVEGDKVVGTVLCGHDGRRGLVHHMVIAPEARYRGLGRGLVSRAMRALREDDVHKCHVLVFRHNGMARTFWERVGGEERMTLVTFSLSTAEPEPDEPSTPGD